MNPTPDPSLARFLVRLYPKPFQQRFGRSLASQVTSDLAETSGIAARSRVIAELVVTAGAEWTDHLRGARRSRPARRSPTGALENTFDALRVDVGKAVRHLAKRPGFTGLALVMLSLGVGANTAIFGFINGALIEPLSYEESDRLVRINQVHESRSTVAPRVSAPDAFDWDAQTVSFDGIAVLDWGSVDLSGRGDPEVLPSGWVSANFFDVLRTRPAYGRLTRSP